MYVKLLQIRTKFITNWISFYYQKPEEDYCEFGQLFLLQIWTSLLKTKVVIANNCIKLVPLPLFFFVKMTADFVTFTAILYSAS